MELILIKRHFMQDHSPFVLFKLARQGFLFFVVRMGKGKGELKRKNTREIVKGKQNQKTVLFLLKSWIRRFTTLSAAMPFRESKNVLRVTAGLFYKERWNCYICYMAALWATNRGREALIQEVRVTRLKDLNTRTQIFKQKNFPITFQCKTSAN